MSVASLSLKLSHFNISIKIKRDELKRQKKLEEQLSREAALKEVVAQRDRIQSEFTHFLF